LKESAIGYGVEIGRADVKDLVFPGNLQKIMNRVLAAERTSQAQLVEARTKAEVQRIEAETGAESQRTRTRSEAESAPLLAEVKAEATRLTVQSETSALEQRSTSAAAYREHPALLRLEDLTTLRELARNANARIFLDFDRRDDLAEKAAG
jgi:regulator of protease activity HflC (stomatin/prohibitin superfamily)